MGLPAEGLVPRAVAGRPAANQSSVTSQSTGSSVTARPRRTTGPTAAAPQVVPRPLGLARRKIRAAACPLTSGPLRPTTGPSPATRKSISGSSENRGRPCWWPTSAPPAISASAASPTKRPSRGPTACSTCSKTCRLACVEPLPSTTAPSSLSITNSPGLWASKPSSATRTDLAERRHRKHHRSQAPPLTSQNRPRHLAAPGSPDLRPALQRHLPKVPALLDP